MDDQYIHSSMSGAKNDLNKNQCVFAMNLKDFFNLFKSDYIYIWVKNSLILHFNILINYSHEKKKQFSKLIVSMAYSVKTQYQFPLST